MHVLLKCPECGEVESFTMPEEMDRYERFEARHTRECSDIILRSQVFKKEDLAGSPIEPISPEEAEGICEQERAYELREWD